MHSHTQTHTQMHACTTHNYTHIRVNVPGGINKCLAITLNVDSV